MARPRDAQRSRVLYAEATVTGEPVGIRPVQELASRVVRSAWFRKRQPKVKSISFVIDRSTRCIERHVANPVLEISRGDATPLDALHAIAHLLHPENTAMHGPEFVRQYLDITRRFCGQDTYKALDAALKEQNVKSRVLSPEAVEARKIRYAEQDLRQLLKELSS